MVRYLDLRFLYFPELVASYFSACTERYNLNLNYI